MRYRTWLGLLALAVMAAPACAQTVPDSAPAPAPSLDQAALDQDWAIHGQLTWVGQATPGFASPYAGGNSLTPRQAKATFDATLFLGAKLWPGAEIWANPEIDQGFGLSDTLGVAGFPSAEAYKVGKDNPYFRLQRLFIRQTIGFAGGSTSQAGVANTLGRSSLPGHRLVLTIGKFGVGDVFDTNAYAHDARGDFLNWALVDTGSFDYAADAWGYSYGAAAELYSGRWTLRLGAFNLSKEPNGETLETGFAQYQLDAELERRWQLGEHPGALRLGLWRNRGQFARLADAIAAQAASPGVAIDLAPLRYAGTRWGGTVNAEQEVTGNLGLFLRAGLSDGSYETYDFTDIDRTLAIGGQLKGTAWGRKADRIGFAVLANGISKERQRYLALGGLGVLIGDGQLPHPGGEYIGEFWYDLSPIQGIDLTADYQLIVNPGYNTDRGPANVFALRVHGAF
jgi:high affinity Mn2+ porin